jgi:hypothetical protein
MGKLCNFFYPQVFGRAFDGMNRSEDLVEDFPVMRVALQPEQIIFHFFEVFFCFGDKILEQCG